MPNSPRAGHLDVVRYLLTLNPKTIRDYEQQITPMQAASMAGHKEVVSLLAAVIPQLPSWHQSISLTQPRQQQQQQKEWLEQSEWWKEEVGQRGQQQQQQRDFPQKLRQQQRGVAQKQQRQQQVHRGGLLHQPGDIHLVPVMV